MWSIAAIFEKNINITIQLFSYVFIHVEVIYNFPGSIGMAMKADNWAVYLPPGFLLLCSQLEENTFYKT